MTKVVDFARQMLARLDESANRPRSHVDKLTYATESVRLLKEYIAQINAYVLEHGFTDKREEIEYFKLLQPQIYGQLIYHVRFANIESRIPPFNTTEAQRAYEKEIRRIQSYFNRHRDTYRYYRLRLNYFDEQYFTRGDRQMELFLDECFIMDARLCTTISLQFARFRAYELLLAELQPSKAISNQKTEEIEKSLRWEAQKVQLAELIYALDAIKAFGNATPIFIAEMISRHWNVHLSFIHKTFEEIRLRKKNRTPFLDLLKNALTRRMEDDDDK